MAGETKILKFAEGVTVDAPAQSFLSASNIQSHADDAAYAAAKGSAAVASDIYYNTTDNVIRYMDDVGWKILGQELPATAALFFGDPTTDGSWKVERTGNNLGFYRRESGSWNIKTLMEAE